MGSSVTGCSSLATQLGVVVQYLLDNTACTLSTQQPVQLDGGIDDMVPWLKAAKAAA